MGVRTFEINRAPIASPTFTGTATTPNLVVGTSSLVLGGNLTTTGAFATTLAATAATTITLPAVSTTLVGKTGTMVANYLSYWNDVNQLTGSANATLTAAGQASFAGGVFGTLSPVMITPGATTRDGGYNTAIEIQSSVANAFPVLLFSNQTVATRYGSINWTRSTSGDVATQNQGSLTVFESGNRAFFDILLNANTGTTSISRVARFSGGIGVTFGSSGALATAKILIDAGTATASTAPLKLTTGTNLTVAEAGAVEYDGTTLYYTNGGLQRQELIQSQQSRVSTQFDATNTTVLANITGLTATLVAGKIYKFEATLFVTKQVLGGEQYSISGSGVLTATAIVYEVLAVDNGGNLNTIASRQTALDGAIGQANGTTGYTKITGIITCGVAGNLTVRFAQNVANAAASSVLVGSTFVVSQIS